MPKFSEVTCKSQCLIMNLWNYLYHFNFLKLFFKTLKSPMKVLLALSLFFQTVKLPPAKGTQLRVCLFMPN